ncbi:hypothetical protein BaRGS_00017409 [Batillaria attramentaria]|uniref:Uncharacterized protein n=1 Tax=Batillaria attramentaria TaxID=370345 RepID=A0ABD0KVX0_9CAEN
MKELKNKRRNGNNDRRLHSVHASWEVTASILFDLSAAFTSLLQVPEPTGLADAFELMAGGSQTRAARAADVTRTSVSPLHPTSGTADHTILHTQQNVLGIVQL